MKVSVVIPTYNRPNFLERLLLSVKKQTYHDFEVIVVDDNSVQKQEYDRIISHYQLVFPSLTFIRNDKNSGAPYTRNRGIEAAGGSLIALVDDDDEWLPEKLEKQVDVFNEGGANLGLVYTWTKAIDQGNVLYEYTSEHSGCPISELLSECFIPSPSVMVRKTALTKAGMFDTTMPSCQDWDMWTRILALGFSCDVVKSFVTIYHKHPEDTIGSSPQASKGYEMYYRKHLPLYKKYHKKMYMKIKVRDLLEPVKNIIKKLKGR